MRHPEIAALAAAGLAFAGVLTAAWRTADELVRLAVDRKKPAGRRHTKGSVAGGAVDRAYLRERRRAAGLLEQAPCETIRITADDGTELLGHFLPAQAPERLIIAAHGWRTDWSREFGLLSGFWQANRCSVLFMEQRGQNGSGGACMGLGLAESRDCAAWARWAAGRCGDLPIYLAGISMGATTVLYAAGLPLPAQVRGIIADCGFTSPDTILRYVARNNLRLRYRLARPIANLLYRWRTGMPSARFSTQEALRQTEVPVLFIHGLDDHFVPVSMTYRNYSACASPKYLLTVEGADHGMSCYKDRAAYEQAVLAFWSRFDTVRTALTGVSARNDNQRKGIAAG